VAELHGPVVVRCAVCGESLTLDRQAPVAAAEISLFIEAHAGHDGMRIDVSIRGDEDDDG
jgi:hypothetical protein